jgi:hypothetical protein
MQKVRITMTGEERDRLWEMRDYIINHPKYKDKPRWTARVLAMPVPQVAAIYKKFKQEDYKKIQRDLEEQEKDNANYHQINIWEYMWEKRGDENE